MHHHLTQLARHGWAFVPGLVFFALLVLPELNWQHMHREGCLREPSLWFWVAVIAVLGFGVVPYALLHMVGSR